MAKESLLDRLRSKSTDVLDEIERVLGLKVTRTVEFSLAAK